MFHQLLRAIIGTGFCVAGVAIIAQSNVWNTTPNMLFWYLSVPNFVWYSISDFTKTCSYLFLYLLNKYPESNSTWHCKKVSPTIWTNFLYSTVCNFFAWARRKMCAIWVVREGYVYKFHLLNENTCFLSVCIGFMFFWHFLTISTSNWNVALKYFVYLSLVKNGYIRYKFSSQYVFLLFSFFKCDFIHFKLLRRIV